MSNQSFQKKEKQTSSISAGNRLSKSASGGFYLEDNRPQAIVQRKLSSLMYHYTPQHTPIQKKPNNTGLSDNLKSGIENLSGYSMDDVKVHYNSSKPAQLNAHAYAQGTDIHLASGQEKHLPHEAWHVVQQKQGRVQPSVQMNPSTQLKTSGKVDINDDVGLEKEADLMGERALLTKNDELTIGDKKSSSNVSNVVQGYFTGPPPIYIDYAYSFIESEFPGYLEEFIQIADDQKNEMNLYDWLADRINVHMNDIFDWRDGEGIYKDSQKPSDSMDLNYGFSSSSERKKHRRKQKKPKKKELKEQGTEMIVEKSDKRVDMEKIYAFLDEYQHEETSTFKTRKSDQRFEVHTQNSAILKDQLKSRKKGSRKKYTDPTYHETVQYIDLEYKNFAVSAEKFLTDNETRIAYDILLSNQKVAQQEGNIEVTGPSPLTSMTPSLLSTYQDMHYKGKLIKVDDTSTTRAYETDYTEKVTQELEFSHWRPFVLPEDSTKNETSMVNAIGGTLDVQTPTSGKTLGQGKVYSAIFKHFQKMMELVNKFLDEKSGAYNSEKEDAFIKRTYEQNAMLDDYVFNGLFENEKMNFDQSTGFDNWESLEKQIDELISLITASLDSIPDNEGDDVEIELNLDKLQGNDASIVKQFELIGTIIGLMIKKEKRKVLNYQILGDDLGVDKSLKNLYTLSQLEKELNSQLSNSEIDFMKLQRENQNRKNIQKELDDL